MGRRRKLRAVSHLLPPRPTVDTPELARKTEAELHAEAQAALDAAQTDATKLESKFIAMWDQFPVQIASVAVSFAILGGVAGHYIR